MNALFRGGAERVAERLLGATLACGDCSGRIIETEAYLPKNDPASHSHCGPTARNSSMFLPAGHVYVYRIYGVHLCFNVVTGAKGSGEAVLIRALEPLEGIDLMAKRRGRPALRDLCSGPGKLVQALGIELGDDGSSLDGGRVRLACGKLRPRERVERSPRIGISKATELELRFRIVARGAESPQRRDK